MHLAEVESLKKRDINSQYVLLLICTGKLHDRINKRSGSLKPVHSLFNNKLVFFCTLKLPVTPQAFRDVPLKPLFLRKRKLAVNSGTHKYVSFYTIHGAGCSYLLFLLTVACVKTVFFGISLKLNSKQFSAPE